ncbi:hypothetical protein DICPUDRAFT_74539 [Dictyostelium purpureum]|uniref:AAA+ ATPase domain-containing protein n=1 Tax=Dictyostelium purpureum TaxID=5786 RepID=F0Z815_DICPU|nr:uncharacterized protein DICPUDRAFT_74539 [Dictyostelium purpureum]EGC39941.1 hypothetical protein DICPUDRAFT_74539 [Dictyostelium purpureum]|eukprot:XP_003283570.1 hypothetical protein DICPUDRAFT_74539 [Dictyostelium purpureum]
MKSSDISKKDKRDDSISLTNNNNNSNSHNNSIRPTNRVASQKRNINNLSDEIEDIEECEEVVFKSSMMKSSRNSFMSQSSPNSFTIKNQYTPQSINNTNGISNKKIRPSHSQSPTSIFSHSQSPSTSSSPKCTSPNSSSTSITFSPASHSIASKIMDSNDEESDKFYCIYGEKCTDKSESHLMEYSHKKKRSSLSASSSSQSPSNITTASALSSSTKIYNSIVGNLSNKKQLNHSNNSDIINNAIIIKKKEKTEEEKEKERILLEEEEILGFSGFENLIKVSPTVVDIEAKSITISSPTTVPTSISTTTTTTSASPASSTKNITSPPTEIDDTVVKLSKPFKPKKTKEKPIKDEDIFDDIEIDFNETFTSSGSTNNLKNFYNGTNNNNNNLPRQNSFKSAINGRVSPKNNNNNIDDKNKMFIDKHIPISEGELVVHKTRVDRVKIWFQDRLKELNSSYPLSEKLLFLTGPTGVGKSTLVRVLSKTMDFEIVEWINPPIVVTKNFDDNLSTPYSSTISEFKKWVKYNSQGFSMFSTNINKVLFIEDIPNVTNENRLEFLKIFENFLENSLFPMVFVLSDSFTGNSGLYQLFPNSFISNNRNIFHIQFNPVAPSYLRKLLQKIAVEEGYGNAVSQSQLNSFVDESAGDIRAAIFSLEFFCVGRKHENPQTSKLKKPRKQQPTSNHTTEDESKVNGVLPRNRDSILTLFHSIGKILYNKRIANSNPYVQGETWYKEKFHRETPENVVEEVFENSHIDYNTFINFVHENYPTFYSSIDEASQSLEYLCNSDIFDSNKHNQHISLSSYNDMLPKSSISVSLRGFTFSHTQSTPRQFFHFIKPRINEPTNQSHQYQQLFTDCISTRVQQSGLNNLSGFQEIPRSILQKSPLFLEVLPTMNSINKSLKYNNGKNSNTYRNQFQQQQSITTQIMKFDHKLLLDFCTFKNNYSLSQYNFSKDNQVDQKFVSIGLNDEQDENNYDNQQNQQHNNDQSDNNDNDNDNNNNNNNNKIVSFYGNNEVLKYDDIVDD